MRTFILFITLMFTINFTHAVSVAAVSSPEAPNISSDAAIVLEENTGAVLYEKNADVPMYPASLTKMATAIYALERGNEEDIVTVSEEARNTGGSSVYLMEDEQVQLKELVQGLLINSGNDAGVAIAEHMSGSVEQFAADLNQYLEEEVGVKQTHFENPHGLFNEDHKTTAKDLAAITRYAMKNEQFRDIFGTKELEWSGESWETTLYTHHKLMREDPYDGITGGKTGYVFQSGFTLATTASRGKTDLIVITLKSDLQDQSYTDTEILLDYGFEHYETSELEAAGNFKEAKETYVLPEHLLYTHLKGSETDSTIDSSGRLTISYEDGTPITSLKLEKAEEKKEPSPTESHESGWTEYVQYLIFSPTFWAVEVLKI
ncbi:D-alanyl-D-alanine carboxypeptidase family protein [Halobacillus litoralis]|uniref:D-alanyl-D-alanine carboxypeptidase family protein n=1 Tax=Halobacillus litoralis TaxID=45668 RepID=UPI001CFC7982|nr:D-alanyl-D-alanine carboxypeptidase family protein [Halobacillus litoralis]